METIKNEINRSIALFFLVGKKLLVSQSWTNPDWRYTQNWLAFEIGLACEKEIDVWAICEKPNINFPMPYVNNYLVGTLEDKGVLEYLKRIVDKYAEGMVFKFPYTDTDRVINVTCLHSNCGAQFNLHNPTRSRFTPKCPQCLNDILDIREITRKPKTHHVNIPPPLSLRKINS